MGRRRTDNRVTILTSGMEWSRWILAMDMNFHIESTKALTPGGGRRGEEEGCKTMSCTTMVTSWCSNKRS